MGTTYHVAYRCDHKLPKELQNGGTVSVTRSRPRMRIYASTSPWRRGLPRAAPRRHLAFDSFRTKPGVEVVGERRIRSQAESWWPAWRQFFL
jgi:hypothetical protein